jgi:nucleoside-diphosphate-sugar epimerase
MTAGLEPHVAERLRTSDMRIVIAGAGGWLGLATLDLLKSALGDDGLRRVECFGSNRRTLTLLDGTDIVQRPLSELPSIAPRPTILLHFAFLTKDRAEAMDEDTYRASNRRIDDQVLGALGPIGAEAVFVASSGAAASAEDAEASPAMRLYGALKQDQEARFAAWAESAAKRAVIARIFNISGPYINKARSYALAAFIQDALSGQPIAVNAPHRVVRSYVAVRELMSLAFALLLDRSRSVTRFDSGGEPMEMQDIAAEVSRQSGDVAVHRPPEDPTKTDHYAGDVAAYRALLTANSIEPVPFARQVAETIDFFTQARAT